ncbi:protein pxr1 [Aspergillus caelatus]|uniref:Protein PXR1 n=2 Tax=Aspergillus subgen. Circumdati TaxID=2720871 RepID=A0A5N7A4N9_9EURO|nr:protein pxr1 [Aspergillus caelatus]KAE8364176.1 protein pxr1 [Aspergillus caelatus]KAE8417790.1 protein pxr1 [Aspergillus pseudocaelatus]
MGLAAPRKRTKISNDPNNTNWSRSTSGYGHKIMSSQGWTPGSFLGARNAAHADMFTAASASHIRVVVKDDTLGLGARSKRDPLDEPTGLDAFKGLLGRLNGKSDADLEAEQKKREDAKIARYAATKWHTVRFISGGLLAQEKLVSLSPRKETPGAQHGPHKIQSGLDLQKSENDANTSMEDISFKAPREEKVSSIPIAEDAYRSKDKRHRKDKQGKKDKKDRKAKKRKHMDEPSATDSEIPEKAILETSLEATVNESRDASSQVARIFSKERRPMGRHLLRGRHIAQKKKALMDDRSLNEIFMVKS